jgi:hypothetical protein
MGRGRALHDPLEESKTNELALVAQWIEQGSSKPLMGVRFPPRAQEELVKKIKRHKGGFDSLGGGCFPPRAQEELVKKIKRHKGGFDSLGGGCFPPRARVSMQ